MVCDFITYLLYHDKIMFDKIYILHIQTKVVGMSFYTDILNNCYLNLNFRQDKFGRYFGWTNALYNKLYAIFWHKKYTYLNFYCLGGSG